MKEDLKPIPILLLSVEFMSIFSMKHKSLKTDALFSQIEHKYVFHVHKNDLKHTAKTEHHGN